MADPVYHMVHYREFEHYDPSKSAASLETLCRQKLSEKGAGGVAGWESIAGRLMTMPDGTGMALVLNRVADHDSAIFGELCLIHPDARQTILDLHTEKKKLSKTTTAEIYKLLEQAAPDGTHFIKGLAYFLIIGNHLFFIRSHSLTYRHIEAYLLWLVTSGAQGIAGDPPDFKSKFDKAAFAGGIGDIRALRISGPSFPQMEIKPASKAEEKERTKTRKVADKFVQFGQAFEVVKTIFGPDRANALAESLGPKERLVVDATVKIRGSRTETSRDKLAEIAKELDGITDGTVGVEGKDGKMADDDVILRTSMPFERAEDGSSLLDFDVVADQLHVVYQRFVDDKKIKA